MVQVSVHDEQARFRCTLRRSGALRRGLITAAFDETLQEMAAAMSAWRRTRRAAKDAASGPVAQQDRAAVS